MENDRSYRILLYCLKENITIPQNQLAEQFEVSHSTIRLEIDKLEKLLLNWRLQVVRKRGVGVCIKGDTKDKEFAIRTIQDMIQKEQRYQNDELEYGILLFLFQHMNHYVRITDLAEAFFVSESVIQKRLKLIKERMKASEVQLKAVQNKGIMISGKEEKVRKFFAKLMATQQTSNEEEPITNVKEQIMTMLDIKSDAIFQGIAKCEETLNKAFSDEARNALAIHIAIAIKRSYQHQNVPCYQFVDQNSYQKEYHAAHQLFSYIMEHYGIPFNEDEVYYLFLHLISAKVIEDPNLKIDMNHKAHDSVVEIAKDLVALVNNVKQIHIDQVYLENLILHLRPMMNRLEYGIELENPLLSDIKTSFPEAYGIAWMCNPIIRKYLQCELSENEAGYIAMHVQAMIESNNQDIKIVIVCSSGVGVSQLLATQIEKHFSRICIVSVDSLASFKQHQYGKEIDLVLSTFPLKSTRPLLIVNPFLSSDDIHAIHHFINEFHIKNKPIENPLKIRAFLHQDWADQTTVIHEVAKHLLQAGEVNEGFESSVHAREQINSTAIGMNTAIPHASFETIVTTQVVVVTLNKAICWSVDDVDLIMFVLVNEQDIQWANVELKRIYRKLYTNDFHQEIMQIEDEETFIKKIR